MTKNLIKKYLDITIKYTDAPMIFQQASAYHVISSTLGQFFEMPNIKCGRPNLWFIPSSIPGRMRRSTIGNFNEMTIFNASICYLKKTEELSDKDSKKKYMLSIIEDGSPEGITDAIIEGIDSGIRTFNICSNEFGDVLRKISGGRHYSQGVDTLLSRLYYGERYIQRLSQRRGQKSRYIPEGLYVTMFSCIQEPHLYLNKTMSRQGLLRRIIFIYVKPEDLKMDSWKSPFEEQYSNHKQELIDFAVNDIAPKMIEYKEALDSFRTELNNYKILLPADLHPNVRNNIEKIAHKSDEKIISEPSDYNIYQQTQWEQLTKLSIVDAIADGSVFGEGNEMKMVIAGDQHYNNVKNFHNEISRHSEELMDELEIEIIKSKVDKSLDRVYKFIHKAGPDGIKHMNLLNKISGMNTNDLKGYVNTLREAGRIITNIPEKKGQGRKGVIYVASCFDS